MVKYLTFGCRVHASLKREKRKKNGFCLDFIGSLTERFLALVGACSFLQFKNTCAVLMQAFYFGFTLYCRVFAHLCLENTFFFFFFLRDSFPYFVFLRQTEENFPVGTSKPNNIEQLNSSNNKHCSTTRPAGGANNSHSTVCPVTIYKYIYI